MIPYRVSIPTDIPGGSQYAVIWAQIMSDSEFKGGIETVGRAGAVITGRSSGDSHEAAEITDIDFTRFAFSGPMHSGATVKNVGNTDFVVKYSYTARTFCLARKCTQAGKRRWYAYPGTEYHLGFGLGRNAVYGDFPS